ncbi:MAG: outer membrane lipoprotein LolB [Gammaproteobacteria bacterium]|nr:outer membrane lipoprotein LolB [Gammaproteobacteria bacterium]
MNYWYSFRKPIAVSCLLFISAACTPVLKSTLPTTNDPQHAWKLHQQSVAQIQQWQFSGRLGIVTANETGTVTVHWQQANVASTADFDLQIVGPLGRGNLQLRKNADVIELISAEGVSQASNPELLIWQQTGWLIPVADLQAWVLGLPGQAQVLAWDAAGRLAHCQKGEWDVTYVDYQQVRGISLPKQLVLKHPDVTLKLVIRDFKITTTKDIQ